MESDEDLNLDEMLVSEDGLTRGRRLAALMEWFQPKKEETPVKELPKIDLGPKDPCEGEPMLYVVVKKAINAEYAANFAERCKKVFANRAHRSQRRFLGLFDDSGTPAMYEAPHPHIIRGLQQVFGTTHVGAFAGLMRTLRKKLLALNEKIGVAPLEDPTAPAEAQEAAPEEEFAVNDDE